MNRTRSSKVVSWASQLGPRFLPFADAASEDLPLSRLLRLSLFQISVGMAMVMLVGTLNRVMIVELGVPTSLVSFMVALPLLIAPFRALIGFQSDHHRSHLGWRRVPYIWMGTLMQFGGFSIMPFALLVLSGAGQSAQAPQWVGQFGAAVASFGGPSVGHGMHTTQTAGLALATDLAPQDKQAKVVGLMYVMQLFGMMGSALILGDLLADYSPGSLIRVVQAVAVVTLVLNVIAVWKQEARSRKRQPGTPLEESFQHSWKMFCEGPHTLRRLFVVGLGSMAFTMEDVLLEPYGGEILKLSVSSTTLLTFTLALGGLIGFAWASRVITRGTDPYQMASWGALTGLPAFVCVILAAPMMSVPLFVLGIFLIGLGGGLFAHGTLTASMNLAQPEQTGLAIGAWGAVQATAAGIGVALGGILRDGVAQWSDSVTGYTTVYSIEVVMLILTLVAMRPLLRNSR